MFAITLIKGTQYKISEGDIIQIDKLSDDVGGKITFYDVLLVSKDGENVKVGTPFVEGAAIDVKVLDHGRDKKIRVVKYKKRKRYLRTQGHRQSYTEIEISKIHESGVKKVTEKTEKVVSVKKHSVKKTEPVKKDTSVEEK